jgi:hypothetical protein
VNLDAPHKNKTRIASNKKECMQTEVVVAYFKVQSCHLPRGALENELQ